MTLDNILDDMQSNNLMNNYDVLFSTCSSSIIHRQEIINRGKEVKKDDKRKSEITSLQWGRTENEVILGYKDGIVTTYDMLTDKYKKVTKISENKIISAVSHDNNFVIGTESGSLYYYNTKNKTNDEYITNEDTKNTLTKVVRNPDDADTVAMGGENNDLKLYNLATKQFTFQAKGDRHDSLNLPQPISISDIQFLHPSVGVQLSTVTKQGNVRLYDIRTQRRPIKLYRHDNAKKIQTYTTMSKTCNPMQLAIGTNKGSVQIFDLRKDVKPLRAFKAFMGSVVGIYGTEELPWLLCIGMDRFFKIFNVETNKEVHQDYLKIRPTNLLVRQKLTETEDMDNSDDKLKGQEESEDVIPVKKPKLSTKKESS